MIIRLTLALFLAALAGFLIANAVYEFKLAPSEPIFLLSAFLMLGSFTVLLLLGLGAASNQLAGAIAAYFSRQRRLERQILFYFHYRNRLDRLHRLKSVRIRYFNRLKRERLFRNSGR